MKRSASRFSHLLSLLLVLIAIVVPSLAQTATGSIRGIIYDQSKAIIGQRSRPPTKRPGPNALPRAIPPANTSSARSHRASMTSK